MDLLTGAQAQGRTATSRGGHGHGELIASQTVESEDLRRLLACLAQDDCAHSWRNFGAEGDLDGLLRWENARRPTQLFFFHLQRGARTQLVAAAAVAERVNRDFAHPGFPVLGRCCILPEFRSNGFYRQVLRHRLEHCRARWGSALNAVHIGAVNERISRVITDHGLPDWPGFVHVGEEDLPLAGGVQRVGAYLMLLPEYVRRIQRALEGAGAPPAVQELRRAFAALESGPGRDLGPRVRDAYERARDDGWFEGGRDATEIEQLLAFCRSVPLVGFPPGVEG
jgi:hypothetical protein